MIKIETLSPNTIKITIPEKLKADDFVEITPQIDSLITERGQIRLVLDASKFSGWQNIDAFEKHIGFVKNHQRKIERIAVIAGHEWQHWLAGMVRMFVHPDIRVFDANDGSEALKWIAG